MHLFYFATIALHCLFLLKSVSSIASDSSHSQLSQDRLPDQFHLEVCDNAIVKSIPGGAAEVLRIGKLYLESMRNKTDEPLAPFNQKWKWEVFRMAGPLMTECSNFKVFGDPAKNYDETKRFCDITANYTANETCSVYSLGSNNKWFFEEHIHDMSKCNIETFDCTCNATIPAAIVNRTKFYKKCVSSSNVINSKHWDFVTYHEAMELINNNNPASKPMRGPEYLKIDVEGFEWSFLRSIVIHNSQHPELEHLMPLQIYGEFHLAQDSDSKNDPQYIEGYVGKKLRHYLDHLFIRGGYMSMYHGTTHQTRNTDILLVKVFCHKSNLNNSEYTLKGKFREELTHPSPIDTDSLGVGYTSPLASMGRKDAIHGSFRSDKKVAPESEAVYTNSGNVDKFIPSTPESRDGDFSHPSYMKEGVTPDSHILTNTVRQHLRNTFGTTPVHSGSTRPLDKPRTSLAVLQQRKIGHGAHPQDKENSLMKTAEFM